MTVLTTARLTLKPVTAEDFDDQLALWGDADFTRYVMGRSLGAEEVWTRTLRDVGHWAVLGYGNWSMRMNDGGDYVGSVGVLDYRREMKPPFDAPELGWGVGSAFQGRGLAREGLEAVLAWVDTELKAPRTVCMIGLENAASFKLAQRVGYRPYGEALYHGNTVTLLERPNGDVASH